LFVGVGGGGADPRALALRPSDRLNVPHGSILTAMPGVRLEMFARQCIIRIVAQSVLKIEEPLVELFEAIIGRVLRGDQREDFGIISGCHPELPILPRCCI